MEAAVVVSMPEAAAANNAAFTAAHISGSTFAFIAWADGSLDVVRTELVELAGVLTLYASLELLLVSGDIGADALARDLLSHWFAREAAACAVQSELSAVAAMAPLRVQGLPSSRTARLAGILAVSQLEDVARRLLSPAMRSRVRLSPTSLNLVVDYVTRSRSVFLLATLNERVAIMSSGRYTVQMPYQGADAVAGTMRTTHRLNLNGVPDSDAFHHVLRWGVPPLSRTAVGEVAYTGRCTSTETPWPDYAMSPIGRAIASAVHAQSRTRSHSSGTASTQHVPTTLKRGGGCPNLTCRTVMPGRRSVDAGASAAAVQCCAIQLRGDADDDSGVASVVAAGFRDGRVRVWATLLLQRSSASAEPLHIVLTSSFVVGQVSRSVYCVAISSCGRYILSACADGAARLYCLSRAVASCAAAAVASGAAEGADITEPSGLRHWAASSGGVDVSSQPHLSTGVDAAAATVTAAAREQLTHIASYAHSATLPVWATAFHPTHPALFATGGRDGTAQIWSTNTSTGPALVLAGHGTDVTAVAFHANGLYLLSGGSDGTVRIWDLAGGGDCVRLLRGPHNSPIVSIAASPGGRWAAAGDELGVVTLWDTPSGPAAYLLQAAGSEGDANTGASMARHVSVAWDKTGRHLACGSPRGAIAIWDAVAILDK